MASIRDKWVPREWYESQKNLTDHYKDINYKREWMIITVLDAHEAEVDSLFDCIQDWVIKKEGLEDEF